LATDDDSFTPETHKAIYGLGFFVAAWSVLEASLEVAIAKQLGLGPKDGSHITAGMQFAPKAIMLRSLLGRDKAKHAAAIAIVNRMMSRGERNDLLHSIVNYNNRELVFTRRRNDKGGFTSEEKPYTGEQLLELSTEIANLSEGLKNQLGISDPEYEAWINEAHSEANMGL